MRRLLNLRSVQRFLLLKSVPRRAYLLAIKPVYVGVRIVLVLRLLSWRFFAVCHVVVGVKVVVGYCDAPAQPFIKPVPPPPDEQVK